MEVNILAVIVATIVMFAVGALWFSVLFGKQWGKIHGFYELSKAEQKAMSAKMGPYYGLQLVITIISAWVLAYLMVLLPNTSPFIIAVLVWAGFTMPANVSGVIFSDTKPQYIWPKILILTGEALVRLVIAAWVIGLFA